jgi:hypothetical protein
MSRADGRVLTRPASNVGEIRGVLISAVRASVVVVKAKVEHDNVTGSQRQWVERRRGNAVPEALEHIGRRPRPTIPRRRTVRDVNVRVGRVGAVGQRREHRRPSDAHRVADDDNCPHTRRLWTPRQWAWRAHKTFCAVFALRWATRVDCSHWCTSFWRALASRWAAEVSLEPALHT